ncbi:hypothetical protein [Streptomyces mirabilis]|uniref:hypothetical protein n=1 Tax=Streptomyces mirabilis TaxID=68239 RepID=UPI0036837556
MLRRPGRPSAVVGDAVGSWCERPLGKTGAASHAEATALARAPPLARREGPPRPSPEVLDPFVEHHPGR